MATTEELRDKRAKRTAQNKRNARRTILIIVALFLVTFIGKDVWGIAGVHIPYSDGERSIMVIKFGTKGLLWKTWEGEGVLAQQGFAATYIWPFSIDQRDPAKEELIKKVQAAFESGEPVKIRYEQMAGAVPWRGKTSYFIKEVRFADEAPRN